jgi:uncharacterized membrane protein YfcA
MSFYIYLILGFVGGIPAGMGMGGGTLTIPLLTLLGGVEQKIAQSANLFAFLPMSICALKTHEKNGLLEKEGVGWIIAPAFVLSAFGSLALSFVSSSFLRRGFGVFLLLLAIFSLFSSLKNRKTD